MGAEPCSPRRDAKPFFWIDTSPRSPSRSPRIVEAIANGSAPADLIVTRLAPRAHDERHLLSSPINIDLLTDP
jgi:hypothetical protein